MTETEVPTETDVAIICAGPAGHNNQDHSMTTAISCAESIIAGKPLYDLWRVNVDAEYHEGGQFTGRWDGFRAGPTAIKPSAAGRG